MAAHMIHFNITVLNLDKSVRFYEEAFGLKEVRRKGPESGEFILVYMGDGVTDFELELTWYRDRKEPYNLGENEIHLAFRVDDFDDAYDKHKAMDCICYENKGMGIYFVADPDGYWLEVVPPKK